MIKSYKDSVTRDFAANKSSKDARKVPANIRRIVIRKLLALDEATHLRDLSYPPGNRPEALKGNLKIFTAFVSIANTGSFSNGTATMLTTFNSPIITTKGGIL